MAIQIQGSGGVIAQTETNTLALRVNLRPTDFGALGYYGINQATGTIGAGIAAAAEIAQFRWTSTTSVCAIRAITFSAGNAGTGFAAGFAQFNATIARTWTAAGTGGGVATITTNNGKLRTSMATTGLGEFRIATTAALGAGTKTLDAQPVASIYTGLVTTAGIPIITGPAYIFDARNDDVYPIVLAANEGVSITCTVPATGTWTGGVGFLWEELTAY